MLYSGVDVGVKMGEDTHTTKTAGCWPADFRRWISIVGSILQTDKERQPREGPEKIEETKERREEAGKRLGC